MGRAMSDGVWSFSLTDRGFLRVGRDPALDEGLEGPLTLALQDAGQWPRDVRRYRDSWHRYAESHDTVPLCGNVVCLSLDRDRVVINSFFDDWPDVTLSKKDFDAMLDAYYEYAVGVAGGENVDPEEGDVDDGWDHS